MNKRQKSVPGNKGGNTSRQRNALRIIGGKWRGRQLTFPTEQGLRPTGDRIRETVFNWLAPALPGSRSLDLFSGSGAFGFEAVSRGGHCATLIEHNQATYRSLQENREKLKADRSITILNTDALHWLDSTQNQPFDIVFLDPPFQSNALAQVLSLLTYSSLIHPGTLIYLECARQQGYELPPHWQVLRHKCTGEVDYSLLEVGETSENSL